MYEMTVDGILRLGNSWHGKNKANWMVLWVSVNNSTPEMIVNPKENFQSKMDYLKVAYNEDLTLKTNGNIKIVRYDFIEDLSELNN